MAKIKGVVAAGHQHTAEAAEQILRVGGNAFDAVVAAHLAACVVEPVLASLAGGGFLLAHTNADKSSLYDFFVQTPINQRHPSETDFYPIAADFGSVQQEFHIGLGAIAMPGTIKGLYAIHKDLCTLPMSLLAEPAIELAREGIEINSFQAYILDVVKAIYLNYPETQQHFASVKDQHSLIKQDEILLQPDLADFIECLTKEGEDFFYQGEIAHSISRLCKQSGGHLSDDDFKSYQVFKRKPLQINYRQTRLLTNPAPSSGGTLIGFALKLLESINLTPYKPGNADYLGLLAHIQYLTDKARGDAYAQSSQQHPGELLLNQELIADYQTQIKPHALSTRGTTHISVMDQHGNIASLTTSNGEGCGVMIPGTGIMLNNMLGEEDLSPHGFHRWTRNQRMTSMMAPSIAFLPNNRANCIGLWRFK